MLRGRSKALGVEGHLRQVGIQGYGRLPYGYPMGYHVDTLWDTMWSTLWDTLWRPRNPRGYPQNPWILERDSRETQERLKRDSRQSQDSLKTVSTTPKAWIPKSEKSEMRTDTTHSSSKSSSNKRKSDTKGEGGK